MMRFFIAALLLLGSVQRLEAKEFQLSVENATDSTRTVVLSKLNGASADTLEKFTIRPGKEAKQSLTRLDTGLYSISVPPRTFRVFFISKTEDVRIRLWSSNGFDDFKVESPENRMLDSLSNMATGLHAEADMLWSMATQTPKTKKRYYSLVDSLLTLRDQKIAAANERILSFYRTHAGSPGVKFFHPLYLLPYRSEVAGRLSEYQTEESFQLDHYWDKLIHPNRFIPHHPRYYQKIDEYFMRYAEKSEDGLLAAGDRILATLDNNPKAESVVTKHILFLFERNTPEEFYLRALDHFVSSCDNEENFATELETMERIRKLKVGLPAPDVQLPLLGGEKLRLNSLKGSPVVLVFWASWCPHCMDELPELKKQADNLKATGVKFVAVSLDEDATAWLNAVQSLGISDWFHACEFRKWKSEAAVTYNIHRTPTIYVIGADGSIRGKDVMPADLTALLTASP